MQMRDFVMTHFEAAGVFELSIPSRVIAYNVFTPLFFILNITIAILCLLSNIDDTAWRTIFEIIYNNDLTINSSSRYMQGISWSGRSYKREAASHAVYGNRVKCATSLGLNFHFGKWPMEKFININI